MPFNHRPLLPLLAVLATLLATEGCGSESEPTPDRQRDDCPHECVGTDKIQELACRCGAIPCEATVKELKEFFRDRHDSVEIVEFECLDPSQLLVRVATFPDLFVFFFQDDVLVGFQDGDGEDNSCGGGHVTVGETIECEPVSTRDAGSAR